MCVCVCDWQETGHGSEISYDSYTVTSTAPSSTQLPPAIANLLASTTQPPADNTPPTTVPNPTTMPVIVPSNSAPLLAQSQPTTAPQYNIPPLPVFLNMPPPMQQQIFKSVPVHIQQQMLSSLPPPLQSQLGPLMRLTAPNNNPPFPPVSDADFHHSYSSGLVRFNSHLATFQPVILHCPSISRWCCALWLNDTSYNKSVWTKWTG